jgi:hypothetical protein
MEHGGPLLIRRGILGISVGMKRKPMNVVPLRHGKATMYRYVAHHRACDYAVLGWHIADTLKDTPHGEHAILMVWLCSCPCVEPTGA